MGRLDGKVAVVTGGGSGFGKAIATTYRKEGAQVILTDLSEETGSAAAKDIGAIFIKADVTSRDDWEKVLKHAVDQCGKLDIVVNNAGTTYSNKVSHFSGNVNQNVEREDAYFTVANRDSHRQGL